MNFQNASPVENRLTGSGESCASPGPRHPTRGRMGPRRGGSLPADVLYVRVGTRCQVQAALHPPPLEDIAAIRSRHALAKAMDAHPPPDLRLISSFCCHSLTPK